MKTKKKPNLLAAARTLKLGDMFFYRKRTGNPVMYRYILMLGKGDLLNGYYKYIQKMNESEHNFLVCYNKLKKEKKLTQLYDKNEQDKMYNLYNCSRAIRDHRTPSEKTLRSILMHTKNMKKLLDTIEEEKK